MTVANAMVTSAVQASGWRAIALAALYPLRVLAQPTHRDRPEEGRS
jgi:hypothetical protein